MSDMNLKVTPAELEAKAADFKSVMTQTKSLTDDMMNDVTGLGHKEIKSTRLIIKILLNI